MTPLSRTTDSGQHPAITPVEIGTLQAAFDHFNRELFDSAIDGLYLSYDRKPHSAGYFAPKRFSVRDGSGGQLHQLALNPDESVGRTDEEICQTLAHEMVHAWQEQYGAPSARGYHNREWAAQMKAVGLWPSSTGAPGGKETGQHMSDYIIPGGRFTTAFARLAATGWRLHLQSVPHPSLIATANSKVKFSCPGCDQNAWGKPALAIACRYCRLPMLPTDSEAALPPPLRLLPNLALPKRRRGTMRPPV